MARFTFDVSEELLDAIAQRVAELVAAQHTSRWYDTPGAAEYCAMKEQAIRDAHRSRHLKAHKAGNGRLRFHVNDLEAFLRASG